MPHSTALTPFILSPTASSYFRMMMPSTFSPLPELQNPRCKNHLTPDLCMGGFLPPRDSHRSTWAACPAALLLRVSPVFFLQQHACASRGHLAAPGPLPFLLSTPPVESIPRLFPADSPARQFEFHIGTQEGKKRFFPPTETISFSSSTSVSTMSGLCLCQPGGSQPFLPPACSTPGAEGWPEAAPKLAPTGGHQPCSHLLWDTLVSCGTAHSKTAAGQAAWDPGGSGEMALEEDMGNVAHLLGNMSTALHERH